MIQDLRDQRGEAHSAPTDYQRSRSKLGSGHSGHVGVRALCNPENLQTSNANRCHSNIEANLVIICCSLPALRLFVRHFAPKLMTDLSLTRSRTGNTGNGTGNGKEPRDRSSRTHSGYGRMGSVETGPNKSIAGYPMDDRPQDKGWSESRCEYAGHTGRRLSGFDFSHLEDATTSNSDLSDDGQTHTTSTTREVRDGEILKMEAFSVVSEQRVL